MSHKLKLPVVFNSDVIKILRNEDKVRVKLTAQVKQTLNSLLVQPEHSNGLRHNLSTKFESGLNNFLVQNDYRKKAIEIIAFAMKNVKLPGNIATINPDVYNQMAELALDSVLSKIKVANINQETNALKSLNQISDSELSSNLKTYAEDLKKQIAINRANHQEVKKVLEENSLESLHKAAKLINPNGKDYNATADQEIDDFFNGGDLIL